MSPSTSTGSPIILPFEYVTDFIEHIVHHHVSPTVIVVCSTRESFLKQMYLAGQREMLDHQPDIASDMASEHINSGPHRLLVPTIGLLASIRSINLVFCPSLQHLRAWLAAYDPHSSLERLENRIHGTPFLGLLNPLQLHRPTSDFAAQGISRTLAAAVEAADRNGMRLAIVECRGLDEEHVELTDGMASVWEEQIPLLNLTARQSGSERSLTGRRVSIGRVMGRWCRFERLE